MSDQTPPAQPPAGWYPDPHDPASQRYWDGSQWTEHTAPGAQPAAATTGGGGGGMSPTTQALIIGAVLLLLIGLGIGGYFLFSGDDGDDRTDAATDDADDDGSDDGGDGDAVEAGDSESFSIPEDGEIEHDFVHPGGRLVIEVRGSDYDTVLELSDADGNVIAENDDRIDDVRDWGGSPFDPLLEEDLPAGEYTVTVRGYAGQAGDAELFFTGVGDDVADNP